MFDGISDFLGSDGFANSIPFVGPILNWFGQDKANKQAQANAELQMQFQEYMSSTAYQRAVKDLEKAGLNPMLAYMKGGSGAGGGAGAMSIPQSNTREAVNSAVSGFQAANLRAQNKLLEAQVQKTVAETAESVSRTNVNFADESLKQQQRGHTMTSAEELMSRMALQRRQMTNLEEEWHRIVSQTSLNNAQKSLALAQAERAALAGKLDIARTGNVEVDTVLKKLEIPLARNLARAEGTWWKENVSPFLPDAERTSRSVRYLNLHGR